MKLRTSQSRLVNSNNIAQEKTNIQIHFLVKVIGMPKYFVGISLFAIQKRW